MATIVDFFDKFLDKLSDQELYAQVLYYGDKMAREQMTAQDKVKAEKVFIRATERRGLIEHREKLIIAQKILKYF